MAFFDGASLLATVPVQAGMATVALRLPASVYSVRASYLGDSLHAPSSSTILVQQVTPEQQAGVGPAVPLRIDAGVYDFAVGDLNADGIPDTVTAGSNSEISIFLGSAPGLFKLKASYRLNLAMPGIAIADLDRDGRLDVLLNAYSSGEVLFLRGVGDGTLAAPVSVASMPYVDALQLQDLNRDGIVDIVASVGREILLLKGIGDGTFQTPIRYNNGIYAHQLWISDVNRDGALDIVAVGQRAVSVFRQEAGSFSQSAIAFPTGFFAAASSLGDLNDDGLGDLAILDYGDGKSLVLYGEASGGLTQPVLFSSTQIGPGVPGWATGRLGQGTSEPLIAFEPTSNMLHRISINGTTMTSRLMPIGPSLAEPPIPDYAAKIRVVDLNGDGLNDVAMSRSSGLVVFYGQSSEAPQAISFAVPAGFRLGLPNLRLQATATSTLPVLFLAGPASVCEIQGADELVLKRAGQCGIAAVQPGSSAFGFAATGRTIRVGTPQTITFPAINSGPAGMFLLGTASSGLSVNYTSATPAICGVLDETVFVRQAGTCSITASQDGDSVWASADPVTQSISVQGLSQTLSFSLPDKMALESSPLTLTAAASSGLPVVFAVFNSNVCALNGAVLTSIAPGTCLVAAIQGGNSVYAKAGLAREIRVGRSQTISLNVPETIQLGGSLELTPASPGGGVTVVSTTPTICIVSNFFLLAVRGGTCSLSATQSGNDEYLPASGTWSFTVKRPQTITLAPVPDVALDVGSISVQATSTSGLPITLTSSTLSTCSIAGSVNLLSAGSCTLIASQPGNGDYLPADPVTLTFSITRGKAIIEFSGLSQTYTGQPLGVSVTTIPVGLPVTLSYPGSDQPRNAGAYTVVATVSTVNYVGAAEATLVISKATPVITWRQPADIQYGMPLTASQLNATTPIPGAFVYSPGLGTVLPVGTQTLTSTFTPQSAMNYSSVTSTTSLVVKPPVAGVQLAMTYTLVRELDSTISVRLNLTNIGSNPAQSATFTSFKLGGQNPIAPPPTIGDIAPAETVSITARYPGALGAPGASSTLSVAITHQAGTFQATIRLALP